MSRRVVAWLVAVVVTGALVVGGVLVASDAPGERTPAVLPALQFGADEATAAPTGAGGPAATGRAPTGRAPTGRPDVYELPEVSYRVRGTLPELPGRARAWTVGTDLAGDRLAGLAAALGVRGQPDGDQSGWTVTGGRRLRVDRQAGLPWRYGTTLPGCRLPPGAAARGVECVTPDVVGGPAVPLPKPCLLRPSTGSGCPRPFPPSQLADLPSRQDAERTARDLAGRAGLDLAGASVRVTGGHAAWVVRIDPAVGGQPTSGLSWSVSVGPKGRVAAASGWLASPRPADSYPLIGVAEAVDRLKHQRAVFPFPYRAAVEAGKQPLAPAKRVLTVTGVRLGLQLGRVAPKGNRPAAVAYLLPAYLFEVEGDWLGVRAVIAVQDRYLTAPPPTLAPQGRSSPAPAP